MRGRAPWSRLGVGDTECHLAQPGCVDHRCRSGSRLGLRFGCPVAILGVGDGQLEQASCSKNCSRAAGGSRSGMRSSTIRMAWASTCVHAPADPTFGVARQHLRQRFRAGLHHAEQLGRGARDPTPGAAAAIFVVPTSTAATTTLAALFRTVTAKREHLPNFVHGGPMHAALAPGCGAAMPRAPRATDVTVPRNDGSVSRSTCLLRTFALPVSRKPRSLPEACAAIGGEHWFQVVVAPLPQPSENQAKKHHWRLRHAEMCDP